MSEPTRRDRDVAVDLAEFICDMMTSRSLYETELLAARDVGGEIVAAYRDELVQQHRRRDELVVAAAMAVLESGSAVSGATTLAKVVLALYEGDPL